MNSWSRSVITHKSSRVRNELLSSSGPQLQEISTSHMSENGIQTASYSNCVPLRIWDKIGLFVKVE